MHRPCSAILSGIIDFPPSTHEFVQTCERMYWIPALSHHCLQCGQYILFVSDVTKRGKKLCERLPAVLLFSGRDGGRVCPCLYQRSGSRLLLMCTVCFWKDDRWWEASRSFETCHGVPVYEPMTGDTHPSTSKFITVHHLPTCSVMTFSQSYKNPRKPVGINQCLSTFPAAAHIHY